MLTIAVSKGRIYDEALPLLADADIVPLDDPKTSRKLILKTNHADVQLVIIRATDVPTFVEYGAADLGIAGKDVLIEHDSDNLYEPLDLNIACCKLMTAVPTNAPDISGRVRVATKYVKTAERYFASKGIQAEIIKLYGAMELAPIVGLADCIVDVVDTGNTLRANGLEPRELIMNISSRLVVNKASMKMKHQLIQPLLDQFEKTLAAR
ncbi:MAG TPA: ATP phosphoribosyltransferase [Methyloprofundus sp.]|jgi:ATP phosphoribosyltransferase|uniref:ATP phosphoribosyltransferase n=1 Tax=Methyloprofundus sp. TaxID=2020875 RepID=UPI001826A20F|nr:ATP phosphoribosyltransferase [Methyloprofundus sp.]MBT3812833.1 ATP phosphoribosyltransferase [Gammaproteobacteria bacterium]HIL78270.1 ATP phosphoribosyltransferase [Methylococcales bacterium]MBT5221870.1 ATP phosphoribosyltransferase [Gammaproteobacteria bacterium]MBT5824896.1 ATP phosphoribosyltransferase [Gammaproteobacteria bacterium]MBT5967057.1 ATP phosphoribosyltransferase [Gammaproteobacteria bacterium]